MTPACDLCDSTALSQVYAAPDSTRQLTVWTCAHCGLVQSLPRADRAARRAATVSAGADWGNLRYGKGFRVDANLARLQPHLPRGRDLAVLDVGANRGAFALGFLALNPAAHVTGIEPDERVVGSWASQPGTTWLHARYEDAPLPVGGFDVVHSCHTLEHVRSARHALLHHRAALGPGGLMFLEVPNLAVIGSSDIVEEFFIDKHLYHFSHRTLSVLLADCGWRIIEDADPADRTNITILATPCDVPEAPVAADPEEVIAAANLIAGYHATRLRNLAALTGVAQLIRAMAPRRVAIWGAGRLLNSLIAQGGLDPNLLAAVVDKNLIRHTPEVHGIRLTAPEALAAARPDVIVVMSRSFADEIRTEALGRVPGCEVVFYSDLLQRAKAAA